MRLRMPLALAAFFVAVPILPAAAAVRTVPAHYSTIQAAVNAAHPGDTVRVAAGIYRENVHVGVANITLQGAQGTILDGTGLNRTEAYFPGSGIFVGDNAITLDADGVTVTGFKVQNYDYGTNEPISQPAAGVAIINRVSSTVRNCSLIKNAWGIRLEGPGDPLHPTENHRILSNDLSQNSRNGAMIRWHFGSIVVENNRANDNGEAGFVFSGANGCQVRYNEASHNGYGVVHSDDFGDLLWVDYDGAGAAGIFVTDAGADQDIFLPPDYSQEQIIPGIPSTFQLNTTNCNAGSGIFLLYSTKQTVRDNLVLSNGTISPYSGFRYGVGIGSDSCTALTLQCNVVAGGLRDGIGISSTTNSSILQNVVSLNGENGIALYDFFPDFPDTTGNNLTGNISYLNGNGVQTFDAIDQSGTTASTVQNRWRNNSIGKSNPPNLR